MKHLKLSFIMLIGMISLLNVSCSDDKGQKEEKSIDNQVFAKELPDRAIPVKNANEILFYVFFPSTTEKPIVLSEPKFYEDAAMTKPISTNYYSCNTGVYTNGTNIFHLEFTLKDDPAGYRLFDKFMNFEYTIKTMWGGSCSNPMFEPLPQNSSEALDIIQIIIDEQNGVFKDRCKTVSTQVIRPNSYAIYRVACGSDRYTVTYCEGHWTVMPDLYLPSNTPGNPYYIPAPHSPC